MSAYSIRELERLSGIKAPTIRIWEKRYGVVEPKRTPTNIRYYQDRDLRKLINLSILCRKGYRISKLAEMDEGELRKMSLEHCIGNGTEDDRFHLLTQAMLRIDERDFERVFEHFVNEMGFEKAILDQILPFLQQLGVLWHTGAIDPAQEHFVSQLVRRKLMRAIESLESADDPSKRFLMFLPEGELHDIGLLVSYYLARKNGYPVCYLGASVPEKDLEKIAEQYHYPYLLTAFTDPVSKKQLDEKVRNYLSLFSSSTFFLTGPQVNRSLSVGSDRLHVIESVQGFREALGRETPTKKGVS